MSTNKQTQTKRKTYFWYLAMMCVTILSVMPGQTSSANRMLRSSSSIAIRCSECSLCCCFNYRKRMLKNYPQLKRLINKNEPLIWRLCSLLWSENDIYLTFFAVFFCLNCALTSVKTGEMTVVRLADLLWSWTCTEGEEETMVKI